MVLFYLFMISCFFFMSIFLLFKVKFNLFLVLIFIEIMIFYLIFGFIIFSLYFNDILSQIFLICIISVASIEISLGLMFLVIYLKLTDLVYLNILINLKD